jgi:hypothetical protein
MAASQTVGCTVRSATRSTMATGPGTVAHPDAISMVGGVSPLESATVVVSYPAELHEAKSSQSAENEDLTAPVEDPQIHQKCPSQLTAIVNGQHLAWKVAASASCFLLPASLLLLLPQRPPLPPTCAHRSCSLNICPHGSGCAGSGRARGLLLGHVAS